MSVSEDAVREARERGFPIYATGGLSNAYYPADESSPGEGWAFDNDDMAVIDAAVDEWLASRSGPSDREVEAAARAIYDSHLPTASFNKQGLIVDFMDSMSPNEFRRAARRALVAARSVGEDTR